MLPSEVKGLEGRAEAANLVGISRLSPSAASKMCLTEFGGKGFGVFKPALAETLAAKLSADRRGHAPAHRRYRRRSMQS
jgi:tryptophanyl-tRNA synthetase